ncbi:hypothetical protein BKA70DRAFT_1412950 [Coprinopsis sp. MPI-PUGE-AT-0042]|nr:hypothetical protein BKA70DRAFT_1412950 [Coprinopsis sp. MPI-PUGE-AT-0042]
MPHRRDHLSLRFEPGRLAEIVVRGKSREESRTHRPPGTWNDIDINRTASTGVMHFSKTYAQILEGLPPGLRDNATQYRQYSFALNLPPSQPFTSKPMARLHQLKKIINQVVSELSSLGLGPELLQELIVPNGSAQDPSSSPVSPPTSPDSQADFSNLSSHGSSTEAYHALTTITLGQLDLLAATEAASHPFRLADLDPLLFNQARVKYEVVEHSDRIEPHLRLWVTLPGAPSVPTPPAEPCFEEVEDLVQTNQLIQGVERRIDVRWKEVEERVAKYTDVEARRWADVEMDGIDSNAPRDVTPERFLRLEKELVRDKAEVTKRLHQLSSIFAQIDLLQPRVGHSTRRIFKPTDVRWRSFLLSTPTPPSLTNGMVTMLFQGEPSPSSSSQPHLESEDNYRGIFANFVPRIEQVDEDALQSNPTIPIGLGNVEPSLRLIEWAQGRHSALEEVNGNEKPIFKRSMINLKDYGEDLEWGSQIWTQDTVRQYEEELNRMLELKQDRMGIHEAEIRKLREERRLKAPLLASIKKYFKICEEEKELAPAASDQTRLLWRGRDPGRLLREEKMRKRVQKEKPREQETGMFFLVYGESMTQALNQTISQQGQENDQHKQQHEHRLRTRQPGKTVPKPGSSTTATKTNSNSGKQAAFGHGRVPRSTTRATPATGGRATRSTSGLGSIQRTTGGVAGMVAKRFPSAGHAALVPSHTGSSSTGEEAEKLGMDIMKKASRAKRESFKPRPSLDRVEMAKMGSYGGFGGGGVREEDED